MNRNKTLESLIVIMREEIFEPCKSLLKTPRTVNKLIYNALDSIQSYSTCRKKIYNKKQYIEVLCCHVWHMVYTFLTVKNVDEGYSPPHE